MIWGYRYIDINEEGCVVGAKAVPTENSIDTEGMAVPEMPTDAIYSLYYSEEQGLYWVKVGEFEPETPEPTQLDRIEETVNSIASGTTAENTEAIDALLGV